MSDTDTTGLAPVDHNTESRAAIEAARLVAADLVDAVGRRDAEAAKRILNGPTDTKMIAFALAQSLYSENHRGARLERLTDK